MRGIHQFFFFFFFFILPLRGCGRKLTRNLEKGVLHVRITDYSYFYDHLLPPPWLLSLDSSFFFRRTPFDTRSRKVQISVPTKARQMQVAVDSRPRTKSSHHPRQAKASYSIVRYAK